MTNFTPFRKEFLVFMELFESGSVSRAAEKLGLGQPSVSKILASLESELGQNLFIRERGGLVPTSFCRRLNRSLSNLSANWREGHSELAADAIAGHYSLGCHPSVGASILPGFYPSLTAQYSELQLELVFAPSVEVNALVAKSRLTFGIVANVPKQADIVVRPLKRDFLAVWGVSGKTGEGPLFFNPETVKVQTVLRRLRYKEVFAIRDNEILANIALQGNAVALLPGIVAQRYAGLKQLSGSLFEASLKLIYLRGNAGSRASRLIVDRIISSVSSV